MIVLHTVHVMGYKFVVNRQDVEFTVQMKRAIIRHVPMCIERGAGLIVCILKLL